MFQSRIHKADGELFNNKNNLKFLLFVSVR